MMKSSREPIDYMTSAILLLKMKNTYNATFSKIQLFTINFYTELQKQESTSG